MATETLFKAAGVVLTPAEIKFSVSRDTKNKEMFVVMDGETRFLFKVLPEPMTKLAAAKYLLSLGAEFGTSAIVGALEAVIAGPVVPVKAPKVPKEAKVKAPKAEKPAKVLKPAKATTSNAAAIMKKAAGIAVDPVAAEAAKAARLETIKKIAAKRKA